MKSNSKKVNSEVIMMQMDPETGEINCLVPVDAIGPVVVEGECAWRVVSAHEMAEFNLYVPPQEFETGCEFDNRIDVEFNRTLAQFQHRPMAN